MYSTPALQHRSDLSVRLSFLSGIVTLLGATMNRKDSLAQLSHSVRCVLTGNRSRDNGPHPCRCADVVNPTVGDIGDVLSRQLFMSRRDARR